MSTFKVELLYSLDPNVVKPSVPFLTTVTELVKQEALERVESGQSLTFRFVIGRLLTINVWSTIEDVLLPRDLGSLEFVVKRKDTQNSQQALVKQVEQFVFSEVTYPAEDWRNPSPRQPAGFRRETLSSYVRQPSTRRGARTAP
jgi:hypothetical protein